MTASSIQTQAWICSSVRGFLSTETKKSRRTTFWCARWLAFNLPNWTRSVSSGDESPTACFHVLRGCLGAGCLARNRCTAPLGIHRPPLITTERWSTQSSNADLNLSSSLFWSALLWASNARSTLGGSGGGSAWGTLLRKIDHASQIVPNWTTLNQRVKTWRIVQITQKATTQPRFLPPRAMEKKMMACHRSTPSIIPSPLPQLPQKPSCHGTDGEPRWSLTARRHPTDSIGRVRDRHAEACWSPTWTALASLVVRSQPLGYKPDDARKSSPLSPCRLFIA